MNPVLIYQMGKVGSTSVYKSLLEKGYEKNNNCLHVHELFNLDSRMEDEYIATNRRKEPWKIITLTREVVARNISDFFQNCTNETGGWFYGSREEVKNAPIKSLIRHFYHRPVWKHNWAINWFDSQLKRYFDVDVYNSPFDFSKNYVINKNVLIIRSEYLDDCSLAIKDFLELDDFELSSKNVGEKKWYGEIYHNFLDRIKGNVREDFIDSLYYSKYMQHFYTKDEIHEFRREWTGCD